VPRPALEVADLLRNLADQGQLPSMSTAQANVVKALTTCRTAALGGHIDACEKCGYERISYNSCRNRHCPKCQGTATAEWLDAQRQNLLPTVYSHVVFTLPELLAPLALQNPRVVYSLLCALPVARCSKSPLSAGTLVLSSAFSLFCTLGDKRCIIIHTSTVSSRQVVWQQTDHAGSARVRASFSPCAF
jgi:predicted Zn-ribbon and HTH transcriptional regulator